MPNTVARAVLFADATIAPLGGPLVDVVATAKADLEAGKVLDALGGYTSTDCARTPRSSGRRADPARARAGRVVRRDVAKDEVLAYDDVEVPEGRLSDGLRAEQDARFGGGPVATGETLAVAPDADSA